MRITPFANVLLSALLCLLIAAALVLSLVGDGPRWYAAPIGAAEAAAIAAGLLMLREMRYPEPVLAVGPEARSLPVEGGERLPVSQATLTQHERDARELEARRAYDAQLEARYRGWKPLTLWYAFWTAAFFTGSVSAAVAGQWSVFVGGVLIAGLAGTYTRYLFNGGRRRVWFIVF